MEPRFITPPRLVQPENAASPIDVTEVGMLIDCRSLQPEKASVPIEVRDVAEIISTEVRLLRLKAKSGITSTLSPMVNVVALMKGVI